MNADRLLQSLGNYGRFQILVFLCLSFIFMRGAWHVVGSIFLGGVPSYSCKKMSDNQSSIPIQYGACEISRNVNGKNITEACPDGWHYGDEFKETIVTEWDLVCDKDYLNELSTTIYMVGNLLGATFLTPFGDKYGRKKTILVLLVGQAAVAIAVSFSNTYILFTVLRFIVGMLNMPIALTVYVMVTELFPSNYRSHPSVAVNCSFSVGIIVLAVFGYFIRDWSTLQLVISIPNVVILFFFWCIPESIPWLISKGRFNETKTIAKIAAKCNNIQFPEHLFDELSTENINEETTRSKDAIKNSQILIEGEAETKYTFLDLFKTPVIRRYTLITFYLWFANSLSYFGIIFATPSLHGNQYLNLGISGAVEIPAQIICVIVMNWVGRRRPLIFFLFLCGTMNVITIFIPTETADGRSLTPLIITLSMLGKFGITGSYAVTYLYGSEIFPTSIRTHAVGLASLCENIGGIIAPFIVYAEKTKSKMSLVIFGVLTIIGGILVFFLPETHRRPLPTSIEEVENMTKDVFRNDKKEKSQDSHREPTLCSTHL